jgi:beta-fructofuranosidase
MSWGHASSADLVTWTDHPIALAPSPDGPDVDGCWSGCVRVVDGRPTAFFSGVAGLGHDHVETVCRAVGDDALDVWTKDPANPLIGPHDGSPDLGDYRDPFVFRDGDVWRMLLATGTTAPDGSPAGAVISFVSPDLDHWSYAGIVLTRPAGHGPVDTGPVWECPQLARIDGLWVLIVSVQDVVPTPRPRNAVWFVGEFVDGVFGARTMGLVDHGDAFYAPAMLEEPSGRVLMWGWLQDPAPLAIRERAGFVGAMSQPRELHVRDGRLISHPVAELDALWTSAGLQLDRLALEAGSERPLEPIGSAFHLSMTVDTSADLDGGVAAVRIRPTDDAAVSVIVAVDARTAPAHLAVTTTRPDGGQRRHIASLPSSGAGSVDLRVDVDGPIVEVFADDGGVTLTVRADPAFGATGAIDLLAVEGPARWSSIDLRRLA